MSLGRGDFDQFFHDAQLFVQKLPAAQRQANYDTINSIKEQAWAGDIHGAQLRVAPLPVEIRQAMYDALGLVQEHHGGGFLSGIARAFNDSVVRVAQAAARGEDPVRALADTPVSHAVLDNPVSKMVTSPLEAAYRISTGDNVFQAFGDMLKAQAAGLPYVQAVLSFVPGVGAGINAAIAAGAALAQGKRIDDALYEGIQGALPGGPAAVAAFKGVVGAIRGQNLGDIAMSTLHDSLPPALQPAASMAIALVHGENIQSALASGAVSAIKPALAAISGPIWEATTVSIPGLSDTVSTGVKLAENLGRSSVVDPVLKVSRAALATPAAQVGFNVANGIFNNAQKLPPEAIALVRNQLKDAAAITGFDTAAAIFKGRRIGIPAPPNMNADQLAAYFAAKGLRDAPADIIKAVTAAITKTPDGKAGFTKGVAAAAEEKFRTETALALTDLRMMVIRARNGDLETLAHIANLNQKRLAKDMQAGENLKALAMAERSLRDTTTPRYTLKVGYVHPMTWASMVLSFLAMPWDWIGSKLKGQRQAA